MTAMKHYAVDIKKPVTVQDEETGRLTLRYLWEKQGGGQYKETISENDLAKTIEWAPVDDR